MTRDGSVRLLVLAVSTAVAAAVVAGLIVVGSPGEARLQKLDRKRVSDLYSIIDAVNLYWTRQRSLPPDLDALAVETFFDEERDPETASPYVYRVLDSDRYEVCATFSTGCGPPQDRCWDWRHSGRAEIDAHGAGEQCFSLTPRVIEGHRRP